MPQKIPYLYIARLLPYYEAVQIFKNPPPRKSCRIRVDNLC
jgi:hypothetical protein